MLKPIRGISLYCGIGADIAAMQDHLALAAECGMNAVFTSLQLPESDRNTLLRDFPLMSEAAHRYGMILDTDFSDRTLNLFGIAMGDLKAIRDLGVDIIRLDEGCTPEETAAMSYNDNGLQIQLNAADGKLLATLGDLDLNRERVSFCHNYYPMRYTGMRWDEVLDANRLIHRHGYRVAGFIPSQCHHRAACAEGLPTLERHRDMTPSVAARELICAGCDDIFFGDDFAGADEMKILAETPGDTIALRIELMDCPDLENWISGRIFKQRQFGLEAFIRSAAIGENVWRGDFSAAVPGPRRRGDISLCLPGLPRYAGEIQINRVDLPADKNFGVVGRVIDEDLPLLETFRDAKPFRLVPVCRKTLSSQ